MIDRTVTAAGARELASRLAAPLTDVKAIAARHEAVEFFSGDSELRRRLREALRTAPDLSRALARLAVGRGGPRDLVNLRDGINAARVLRDGLTKIPPAGRSGNGRRRDRSGNRGGVAPLGPAGAAAGG